MSLRTARFDERIDLGVEPPIEAMIRGPRAQPAASPRRVSLHWLSGTVLTGLLGAALVGAAIYVSLDEQTNFAQGPTRASPLPHKADASEADDLPRGDRLLQTVDMIAAKQTFKTPMTISVGNKEILRNETFTKVATTLTLTSNAFADQVPPFNSLKLQDDAQNPVDPPADPGPSPETDDSDVSFVARDLNAMGVSTPLRILTLDEVQAQVTEHLRDVIAAGNKPALPFSPQLMLMRTSRAWMGPSNDLGYASTPELNSPFASIEVRMVPENVTAIPKAGGEARDVEEKVVLVRHNETFADILTQNGASRTEARAIVAAFGARQGVSEGQKLKLTLADFDGSPATRQIARVTLYSDDRLLNTVARKDDGDYIQAKAVDAGQKTPTALAADDGAAGSPGGLRVYDSIYQSALKQDIPAPLIDELVHIFANDVDFQSGVSAGDAFEAFYQNPDAPDGRNDLLYASLRLHGETYRYYRFQTPEDGTVDFYDPSGRSTRKFLIRKPVAAGVPTSPFGMRGHPVLGYVRMHTGQDWGAPPGTQIFAAGNGTVIKAGTESGYGRHIEIQHANGYVTTYSHMMGFARGIAEGTRVRQGQVIGYVGTTGLSTGPHLHFEVLINGRFVDPMAIKLARTKEFDGRQLGEFTHERDRIDGLMGKALSSATSAVLADVVK